MWSPNIFDHFSIILHKICKKEKRIPAYSTFIFLQVTLNTHIFYMAKAEAEWRKFFPFRIGSFSGGRQENASTCYVFLAFNG